MKIAFVTGGSSGIGKVIVTKLKDNDWVVIAPTRQELDLSDSKFISKSLGRLTKQYPKIDALIHVAGIWHDKKSVYANKDLEDFDEGQIIDTINVGLTSFMVIAAKLLPKMPKTGSVIGISGTFADGASGWLPYYTSKRAIEDFLVGLAQDYPSGPKVYGISPADTATPSFKKFYSQYADEAQSPEVVAKLCLDLINGEPKYKSGEIIEIRDKHSKSGYHS